MIVLFLLAILGFSQATENSKVTGRPLLVLITADNCIPCEAVKIELNKLENKELQEFNITSLHIANEKEKVEKFTEDLIQTPQLIEVKKVEGTWIKNKPVIGLTKILNRIKELSVKR